MNFDISDADAQIIAFKFFIFILLCFALVFALDAVKDDGQGPPHFPET